MCRVTLMVMCVVFAGCASGYQQFYTPYIDTTAMGDLKILGTNEEPQILLTNDPERDIAYFRAKGYMPIGLSSFNGAMESKNSIAAQAKRVGATLVLTNAEFTDVQSVSGVYQIPASSTTYHTGSFNSGSTFGTFSGTSTTFGSNSVPYTYNVRRYDQSALYLAQYGRKFRVGLMIRDLEPAERQKFGRNTGALVDVVVENTPAFLAEILPGDLLVKIDDEAVINYEGAMKTFNAIPKVPTSCSLTLLRNGQETHRTLRLE